MAASKKSSAKKGSSTKSPQKKATAPVKEGTIRTGTDAPNVKADQEQKVGDSTARVSIKPAPSQEGVKPDSSGQTTDTRGSKEGGRSGKSLPDRDEVRNRPGVEQVPTASDTAAKQPIRQTDLPLGHEKHRVDGETVEVFAEPGRVDPDELPPHKRDTLAKDTLRHEGEEGRRLADAPVRGPRGGDWGPEADKRTDNNLT